MHGRSRIRGALLLFWLALGLSGCSTVRSTKLFVPEWFGFTEIVDSVYVDEAMPQPRRQEFLGSLAVARERITGFFGHPVGNPEIFACSTEACYTSHGGVTARGKAYGDSLLLLSPRGLDAVIITHELTHIELHTRIGAWRSWRSVPPWFDEGLAVLVSQDPRFTEAAWLGATADGGEAPPLEDVGRLLGNGSWLVSYGTARRTVGDWYRRAGRAGLQSLIAEVRGGNDFDAAINAIAPVITASASSPPATPAGDAPGHGH